MVIQIELKNGVTMSALGLGVFQTPAAETAEAVSTALRTGYRHIDTAASYLNERSVGEGIRASGVDRDEIFLESKVWVSDFGYVETLHAYDKAVGKLGVDVIDLLILHQPLESRFDRTIAAYRALEHLLSDGRVRAIGVSNFLPQHLGGAARAHKRHPCREPDRAAPVLATARAPNTARGTGHRDSGMVSDRRDHVLPGIRG